MKSDTCILVVDDNKGSRVALSTLIADEGYKVETADNGLAALKCVRECEIDLIVSDVQMPGLDGFAVVRRLRRNPKCRDLPVILVSGQANPDRRAIGLHLGADDFMAKPLNFNELLERIKLQLRHSQRARTLRQEAVRDSLTGTLNRRGILEVLALALKEAQHDESFTSVLMIDLNDFKMINDTRGHAAGDEVLRDVANSLRTNVRNGDRVGRLGGDEFLVVLSNTASAEAEALVKRLHGATTSATFAVGVATALGGELADVLIRRADEAMYTDKHKPRRSVS